MGRRLAALLALAALAAGCGSASGGNSTPDAAGVVPQNALLYATVNTDLGSDQVSSGKSVLERFPGGSKLLQSITASISKSGADPAKVASSAGPVLDVALLPGSTDMGLVVFAQPADVQTFLAQLGTSVVHETIDGWTVIAEKQAQLAAVKNRAGDLADATDYKAAAATVPSPGDAIATAYISGTGIRTAAARGLANAMHSAGAALEIAGLKSADWAAAALTSSDGAVKLELHESSTSSSAAATAGSLADRIPSGSIAAASLSGSGAAVTGGVSTELQALPKELASALAPVIGALGGPVIAYVRPGAPLPEVTVVAQPEHPAAVAAGVGALVEKLTGASAVPAAVGGATMLKVDMGGLAIYYGTTPDGLVVVTDSSTAISELNGSGKLADDSGFKDIASDAGMPDENEGFLYVDAKDLLPTVEGLAQLTGKPLSPELESNLKPLDAALVYGSRDGDLTTVVAYVKTH